MKRDDSHLGMQVDWNEENLSAFASLYSSPELKPSDGELKPVAKVLDTVDENGKPINSGDKARKAMRQIWFGGH